METEDREIVTSIINDRHHVHLKVWQEDGNWWTHIMVDGVLKSHENLGPDH